ncbi:hypothetical protein DFQ26_009469 [Actinomortierella ambigua]|nr:hypothetical protein DFQ26_009469 [Actinomortierella ambigua]
MRILSIAACLALVSIVVAQVPDGASDPLAAVGSSPDYQWVDSPSVAEPAGISREELSDSISELEFRAAFLDLLVPPEDGVIRAEALDCSVNLKSIVDTLKGAIDHLGNLPLLGHLLKPIVSCLENALSTLATGVLTPLQGALLIILPTVSTVLDVIARVFSTIPGVGDIIKVLLVSIEHVVNCLTTAVRQAPSTGDKVAALSFQQDQCYPVADLYRNLVDEMKKNAESVPEGSSDEIKRSMNGIVAVLDLMAKSSIAANNADLLKVQPIFAADVLERFRDAYASLAEKDEQKMFADAGLTATIGASNALEACLRIAKDPTAAIDDLNEDLDIGVPADVAGAPDKAKEGSQNQQQQQQQPQEQPQEQQPQEQQPQQPQQQQQQQQPIKV